MTIQPGGPQVNNRPLLPAGRIDFLMTGNLLHSFDNEERRATVVVAAMFQKDPQALIAHPPGLRDVRGLEERARGADRQDGQFSRWQWLKVTHGFRDEALKPCYHNLGPFLANPKGDPAGLLGGRAGHRREPGQVQAGGEFAGRPASRPTLTVIEARIDTVKNKPDLVALRRREHPRLGELHSRPAHRRQRADDQGQP